MQSRSIRRSGQPTRAIALSNARVWWDLIRGGHYGQRSGEPHYKAGHMAAPTNAAKREESPCPPGAVHTWHVSDMPTAWSDVWCWENSGKHLLAASISPFDPLQTTGFRLAATRRPRPRRSPITPNGQNQPAKE